MTYFMPSPSARITTSSAMSRPSRAFTGTSAPPSGGGCRNPLLYYVNVPDVEHVRDAIAECRPGYFACERVVEGGFEAERSERAVHVLTAQLRLNRQEGRRCEHTNGTSKHLFLVSFDIQ